MLAASHERANVAERGRPVALKQRVEEKQWAIDLPAYEEHHERAERLRKEGDLAGAFREYCRAMRPLNLALQKYRSKEEMFQPVWDKA